MGIAYELVGPDGARAVVGNCTEAQLDPDFVGFLDPENGLTGLMDGAEIREQAGDLVEADGGWHGAFYESRRPGTLQGILLPGAPMATVNAAERKLKQATRALRGDTTLRWTPSGETIERELRLRRQTPVRITDRRPKSFQVGLVSADPRILSSVEEQVVITPDTSVGVLGFTSPFTSPISTTPAATGAGFATNQGTVETWPRFKIDGPVTTPIILNNTTGKQIGFTGELLTGEYLLIDAQRASVLFGGTADRYGLYDFALSEWWTLVPGANDVRLLTPAYSAGAQVTVFYKHAWE